MQMLSEISSGDLLSSGIFPGQDGEAPPLWADGENVVFDNDGVRKQWGNLGLANLGVQPSGLKAVIADQVQQCFVGAGDTAYRYRTADGLNPIVTFSDPGLFQFVQLADLTLINNAVNPLKLWDGAVASSVVTPFTRANVIFKYFQQAFAAGTDNGGNLVEWSPINVFDDWTPTLDNTASNLPLYDLEGDIICARKLAGSIGIYTQSNAGIFTFVGGDAVYGMPQVIEGVHAISDKSVVEISGKHYGITQDNLFITDLLSFVLIDEPAMSNYIAANADWDRQSQVWGWLDRANAMARWAVPKLGGGFFGIGYRYDKGTWTRFNDGIIGGEPSGPFPYGFQVKSDRFLRNNKDSVDNDSQAMPAFVQTKPLDLGDRERYKRISKLSLDFVKTGSVSISLGFTNHPNTAPTWVYTSELQNEIFPDADGSQADTVFIVLKIQSTALGANWRLNGGKIYGELGGLVTG